MAAATRVLLIEPHDDTRELYTLELASRGWQVTSAKDAAAATRAFVADRPTIVVSEARLPGEDALALLRTFQQAGTPVIVLTTHPPAMHGVFSGLRMSAVLVKPCPADAVARAIMQAVRLAT